MKMVNVWFYKSDTDRIAAMFVIHLEGYLADSIKRQLRPLLQYPVCHYIGGRRPKLTPEQWAQAGCLIRAGVPRQQVAIIYDVGLPTLYRKFPVLG
ncbi:hypothetical protein SEEM41H_18232 [Salmonella enterica subsp. enterica serovar Montevideo str. 4441 H]|nr:hypothetical protein SEEM41H_18232 [Salmonella enterica subsp. enterica serovar Montevideo str. 4441 H]